MTARLVMEGRSPAVSGLTFTHRAADEKKFPALCRLFRALPIAYTPTPRRLVG